MDQFLVNKNIAESESDASDPGNARELYSGQQTSAAPNGICCWIDAFRRSKLKDRVTLLDGQVLRFQHKLNRLG